MRTAKEDLRKLERLRGLLARSSGRGLRRLEPDELAELPRLYRFASSLYARLETSGADPGAIATTRDLVRRGHAVLYRHAGAEPTPWYAKLSRLLLVDSPRALRAEWRLLAFTFGFFYAIAIAAYAAVSQHLELAFTLFDPAAVSAEIAQLEATKAGEPFRGNFTFGFGESPQIAGWIMAHNMQVSVIFFASGLVLPLFLLLLGTNALMLGTYTAVAGHWDQAWEISSILWCHGTLELQAIVIAGLAGILLVRPWIDPGPWSRAHAMRLGSKRALHVLAPVFPMLFLAGLIEGFVSPHAPTPVRMAVAVLTGLGFLVWLLLAGRGDDADALSEPE